MPRSQNSYKDKIDLFAQFSTHLRSLRNTTISESLFIYLKEQADLFDFFFTIINLSVTSDRVRVFLEKVLEGEDVDFDSFELAADDQILWKKVREKRHLLRKLLICGITDNFLSYISDILLECSKRQPAILKSSMQIRTDMLLNFTRMSDLREHIAEKTVHELSYKGINDIDDYIKSRLGCQLFQSQLEREKAAFFIEARNIYTHNRGIVNDIFKQRVSKQVVKFKIGATLKLDYDDILNAAFTLNKSVEKLDSRLTKKFKLQAKRFSTWNK